MILSRHLQELSSFTASTAAVISVYLDLDGGKTAGAALRGLAQTMGDERAAALNDDLRRISEALEERKPEGERGLAIFSCRRAGLFRVCPLPQPVKSRWVIDAKPYLAPLLNLADQHQRYGIVLAGARQTRFLEAFMGKVRELEGQALACARTPSGLGGYLRAVAARLESLARGHNFQRVVVGAQPELSGPLSELLHRALQENLILDPGLAADALIPEVCARIAESDAAARRVREFVLVHRLLDGSPKGAALGLRRTLEALERGRLKTLLVRDGFAKLGRRCAACRKLSLCDPKCAVCASATDTVFNLADEIAERTLEQGGEVFRLQNATLLDNVGHIGAVLLDLPVEGAAPAGETGFRGRPFEATSSGSCS